MFSRYGKPSLQIFRKIEDKNGQIWNLPPTELFFYDVLAVYNNSAFRIQNSKLKNCRPMNERAADFIRKMFH